MAADFVAFRIDGLSMQALLDSVAALLTCAPARRLSVNGRIVVEDGNQPDGTAPLVRRHNRISRQMPKRGTC